jgi:hypothetical protein
MENLHFLLEHRNNRTLNEKLYHDAMKVVNKIKENKNLDEVDQLIVNRVKNTHANGLKTFFSLSEAIRFFSSAKPSDMMA